MRLTELPFELLNRIINFIYDGRDLYALCQTNKYFKRLIGPYLALAHPLAAYEFFSLKHIRAPKIMWYPGVLVPETPFLGDLVSKLESALWNVQTQSALSPPLFSFETNDCRFLNLKTNLKLIMEIDLNEPFIGKGHLVSILKDPNIVHLSICQQSEKPHRKFWDTFISLAPFSSIRHLALDGICPPSDLFNPLMDALFRMKISRFYIVQLSQSFEQRAMPIICRRLSEWPLLEQVHIQGMMDPFWSVDFFASIAKCKKLEAVGVLNSLIPHKSFSLGSIDTLAMLDCSFPYGEEHVFFDALKRSKLVELSITRCEITQFLLEMLMENLPKTIRSLKLFHCHIPGIGPIKNFFSRGGKLEELRIGMNAHVQSRDISILCRFLPSNLLLLDLSYMNITLSTVQELAKLMQQSQLCLVTLSGGYQFIKSVRALNLEGIQVLSSNGGLESRAISERKQIVVFHDKTLDRVPDPLEMKEETYCDEVVSWVRQ